MSAKVNDVKIEESWKEALKDEFAKPYFGALKAFLVEQKKKGKVVYPPGPLIFNAFNTTPLSKVKVVIIGQDPYIKLNQAMGLSFSVPQGVRVPPSLRNVYKAIAKDFPDFEMPKHGDLTKWAEQGVFLLNAALTVEHGKSNSHKKAGWHTFTDAVIKVISEEREGIVFLLWGGFAKKKKELIDTTKHHVLEWVHPSPMAGTSFPNCGHFGKTNEILKTAGKEAIQWQV